ncbi:hypothetical protein MMC19_000782 [Ptychographa xylographoides]|nr:hypothetical protein [Ptychographa xylographoides]
MASYISFPPHRLHSSTQIAPSQALHLISAYLEAATTEAYLQPNALLTEGGAESATSGPNTGLTLHHLKRVEAGLRGEHLSADIFPPQNGMQDTTGLQTNMSGVVEGGTSVLPAIEEDEQIAEAKLREEGWQDKAEFELEQDVTQGEIGDRLQAVTEAPGEDMEVPSIQTTRARNDDREDRKKRKKDRRKSERKAKNTIV